jgi:hypothetical protein
MVVVPTSHTVTLRYTRSGAEKAGIALSLVGLVGLVGLVFWRPGDPDARRADPGPDETPGAGPTGAGEAAEEPGEGELRDNASEEVQVPALP